MEHTANISVTYGPNAGKGTPEASRALGETIASLHRGLDPTVHSVPIPSNLFGAEWQFALMECTYCIEHTNWPGMLYLVYPTGKVITASMGELPQQWLLID